MGDSRTRLKPRKRWPVFLTAAFLFLPLTPAVFWGANAAKVVAAASRSCQSIDASVKSNALSVLYLVEKASDGGASWDRFDNPDDAQKDGSRGFLSNAKVYLNDGSPVRVDLELKSPSKEWVHYVRYYFRDDGTLEKTHSDFRRFGAYEKDKGMEQEFLVKVLRDKYYDPAGKMVKKISPRFFNVSNGREMSNVVFTDGPWPIYPQTGQLPFYGSLKTPDSPPGAKNQ